MTIAIAELTAAAESFGDRLMVAEFTGQCAHGAFPETDDPATEGLVMMLAGSLAEAKQEGANDEELLYGVTHALVIAVAWGMTLGGLGALPEDGTSDPDPAVAGWADALADIDPDTLPGPTSD